MAKLPKFMIIEFFKSNEKYRYCLKSRNGQIKLTSPGYSTYRKCVEGWRTVQETLRIWDDLVKYRWSEEVQNETS